MDSNDLLDLVRDFNQFEKREGKKNAKDFARWLYEKEFPQPVPEKSSAANDRMLAYLLQRVGRLGRFFSKKAMVKQGLSSIDDFTIINTLYHQPGIAKKKLYDECVIELSTGTQIIKRLAEQKLVAEAINPRDKRVTTLQLTTKGRTVRNRCFDDLLIEVQFKFSSLSVSEKRELLKLLHRLNVHLTESFFEKDSTAKLKVVSTK